MTADTYIHSCSEKYMLLLITCTCLLLDLDEVTPNEFLAPFLAVIRSEETTGPITGLALTSVNKFLSYGLIGEHFYYLCHVWWEYCFSAVCLLVCFQQLAG